MPAELEASLYTIKNHSVGNVLFEEIVVSDDTIIVGDHPRNEEIQTWLIQKNGDGSYYMQSGFTAKFLAVNKTPRNGATLIGSETPQRWTIEQATGSGFWLIRVPGTQLSLHLPDDKQGTKCRLVDGGIQSWILE